MILCEATTKPVPEETCRRAARSPGASGGGLSRGSSAPTPCRGRGGGFSLGSAARGLGAWPAAGGFCAKLAALG